MSIADFKIQISSWNGKGHAVCGLEYGCAEQEYEIDGTAAGAACGLMRKYMGVLRDMEEATPPKWRDSFFFGEMILAKIFRFYAE